MALILYEDTAPLLQTFHAANRTFKFDGLSTVNIKQDWKKHGVAAVVWESAIVLGTLLQNISTDIKGKNVLELGSGTGLSGIVATLLGARVTFTDLKGALSACSANIDLNLKSDVHSYELNALDWTKNHEKKWSKKTFDYIIGADLIYIEEIFQDLINTISFFMSKNESIEMFLSGKIRYEKRFSKFKNMLDANFNVRQIYFDDELKVYILKILPK